MPPEIVNAWELKSVIGSVFSVEDIAPWRTRRPGACTADGPVKCVPPYSFSNTKYLGTAADPEYADMAYLKHHSSLSVLPVE